MQHWSRIGLRSLAVTDTCRILVQSVRNFTEHPITVARTQLKKPKDHTSDHIGMWYTLDPEMDKRLFQMEGLTRWYKELAEIFCETSFMIREPAIKIIDYVSRSNLAHPPNKFILYGKNGTGKTMTLAHVVHHFIEEGWILVHAAYPMRWRVFFNEILPSTTRDGFYDHTVDASLWLQQFRQQNGALLENPDLVTTETYEWTRRESTEKGSPFLSLIEFGISRARYASDCAFYLTTELKKCAQEGRIKVAVVIDGINTCFVSDSNFMTEACTFVQTDKFTLFQAFLQLLQNDWKNGVIVGSVDMTMGRKERRESCFPRYLLGKKGWETLDPFVPILMDSYTDAELDSAVNYYVDRMWFQHPAGKTKQGKEELAFLTANNPVELIQFVNAH